MNIGVRSGRRTAAATLALIGLLIVSGPFPGPAHADTIRSVANVCDWLAVGWDQLSDAEKQAFQTLGWSQANWGSNNEPASSLKDWSKLTPDERNAAQTLGFNEQKWQVSCPSH